MFVGCPIFFKIFKILLHVFWSYIIRAVFPTPLFPGLPLPLVGQLRLSSLPWHSLSTTRFALGAKLWEVIKKAMGDPSNTLQDIIPLAKEEDSSPLESEGPATVGLQLWYWDLLWNRTPWQRKERLSLSHRSPPTPFQSSCHVGIPTDHALDASLQALCSLSHPVYHGAFS